MGGETTRDEIDEILKGDMYEVLVEWTTAIIKIMA